MSHDKPTTFLDFDALIARIEAEVARRELQSKPRSVTTYQSTDGPGGLDQSANRSNGKRHVTQHFAQDNFPLKERYHLNDFLRFHGTEFLDFVYLAVLHRLPDANAKVYYLKQLNDVSLEKAEIIGRVRYSREGRKHKTPIAGLKPVLAFQVFCRIPILGYLARLIISLVRLPIILIHLRRWDNFSLIKAEDISDTTSKWGDALAAQLTALSKDISARWIIQENYLVKLKYKYDLMREKLDRVSSSQTRLLARIELNEGIARAAIEELRSMTSEQKADFNKYRKETRSKLTKLHSGFETLNQNVAEITAERLPSVEEQQVLASIEGHFRGPESEIRRRLEVYVPELEVCKTHNALAVDIGCGRGEWLEIMGEQGVACVGVEIDPIFVKRCREKGLDVQQMDAFDYLENAESDSIGLISIIHVIEHFPPAEIMRFLLEARRSLIPAGKLIIETPNPENLRVSAYTFYFDLTHQKPIPAQLLEIMLSKCGFGDIVVKRLHAVDERKYSSTDNDQLTDLTKYLYGPQDYAIVARKPNKR